MISAIAVRMVNAAIEEYLGKYLAGFGMDSPVVKLWNQLEEFDND